MKEFKYIPSENVKGLKTIEGFPTFNGCDHYLVDMSNLRENGGGWGNDWMNTISVKLPNDKFVTLCLMQCAEKQFCIDVNFSGDNIEQTMAMGFQEGRSEVIKDKGMYTVILDSK